MSSSEKSYNFQEFRKIISKLRDPKDGCPWDLEQDHKSIRQYFIEETYEAIDAINSEDDKELCSELGDVLLQVMLHAQIAEDRDAFKIEDVIQGISEKMIRRHPHVFGDRRVENSDEVKKNWEEIKQSEKKDKSFTCLLKDVPNSLPALIRAKRLGDKASKAGFDWPDEKSLLEKFEEERAELLEAKTDDEFEDELGDVLFVLAQLARKRGISPEDTLRRTSEKFISRFSKMEAKLGDLRSKSLDEMEAAWQQAKNDK